MDAIARDKNTTQNFAQHASVRVRASLGRKRQQKKKSFSEIVSFLSISRYPR